MDVHGELEAAGLTLDDVRWHLSLETTKRLLTYVEEPEELAKLIWSSSLESDLYEMEDKAIARLQEDIDRGLSDDTDLHEFVESVRASRHRRQR